MSGDRWVLSFQDARRRRRVRVVAEGELVWLNPSGTRAKVRVTDENGQRRHLRVPIEQVEAL